jgi:hypothetical protein
VVRSSSPGSEEHLTAGGESTDQGGDDEDVEPGTEHASASVEVALDAGERDVGDGVVDDKHQLGGGHDQ